MTLNAFSVVLGALLSARQETLRRADELDSEMRKAVFQFFGDNPGLLRIARGDVPQKVVSLRTKVPQPHVSLVESGLIMTLSLETIQKLVAEYAKLGGKYV